MPDCGLPLPCESTVAVNGDALTIANDGGGGAITAFANNGTFGVRAAGRVAGVFAIGLENGVGVFAQSTGVEGGDSTGTGVVGLSDAGPGMVGQSASGIGVLGTATTQGTGVRGTSASGTGVDGNSTLGIGVRGNSDGGGGFSVGVFGTSSTQGGYGVIGSVGTGGFRAGFFAGDVQINGSLSKAGGGFRIDHPLEPAHKYLSHSFVESPEMKNVYDGVVALDEHGECRVELPEWFEAVNCDFRYQLTSIGEPAPNLHVAQEISNNHFNIAGGKSGMKVSWQVTGIRKDAWAQAHPLIVEEEKPENERGYYLYPELYDQPRENSTFWKGNSELMRQLEERRDVSAERNQVAEQVRGLTEMARRPRS